jgi:hypothetical protein
VVVERPLTVGRRGAGEIERPAAQRF